MKNSYKFFNNRECKYFPCHSVKNNQADNSSFNCLFCYCPLYSSGEKCGGNFKYSGATRIKNCTDCDLPHLPEYYDVIIAKLKEK